MVFEFLDQIFSVNIGGNTFTLTAFVMAGIFMAIGVIIAKIVRSIFNKRFAPSLTEHSAKNTSKFLYYGIIIVTFLGVITSQGIDLSGLIVAGGIFGVVIGFATQSVVSNLISGFFLMIEKPAKIGDLVEIQGMGITGTVMDMTTFSTKIRIADGTVVRIPNDKVFTSNIRSVSGSSIRRMEKIVGIGYTEKINIAKTSIINKIEEKIPYVLIDPQPKVIVEELADSSVNLKVILWHSKEHWAKIDPIILEVIKESLDDAGIEIPFPHRVIKINKSQLLDSN